MMNLLESDRSQQDHAWTLNFHANWNTFGGSDDCDCDDNEYEMYSNYHVSANSSKMEIILHGKRRSTALNCIDKQTGFSVGLTIKSKWMACSDTNAWPGQPDSIHSLH